MQHFSAIITADDQLGAFFNSRDVKDACCGASAVLVQLFCSNSDHSLSGQAVTSTLELYPDAVIVGASSYAEISAGRAAQASLAISLMVFKATRLASQSIHISHQQEAPVVDEITRFLAPFDSLQGLLMLAASRNFDIGCLLAALHRADPELPLFGGLAGDHNYQDHYWVLHGRELLTEGLVIVAFCSEHLHITRSMFLGWERLGKQLQATSTDNRKVYAIDGRPAFDIYHRYLGLTNEGYFFEDAQEFPLLVEREGITIARVPYLVNEDLSVQFLGDIREGEAISFGYANLESFASHVDEETSTMQAFGPQGILCYSCGVRYFLLGDDVAMELAPLQTLAETAGFFTFGEIFNAGPFSTVLNSTLVLVGFKETLSDDEGAVSQAPAITCLPSPGTAKLKQARILSRFQHFTDAITQELLTANQELERLARCDSLTGLFNRRYMESRLLEEIERSRRYGHCFNVIFCDIDYFKAFNDTWGHIAGDEVLVEVANLLIEEARVSDTVCRYGGEEFLLLMPESDLDEAYAMIRRIQLRLQGFALSFVEDEDVSISLSFGLASFPRHGVSLGKLLRQADGALYDAKNAGRNCLRIAASELDDEKPQVDPDE